MEEEETQSKKVERFGGSCQLVLVVGEEVGLPASRSPPPGSGRRSVESLPWALHRRSNVRSCRLSQLRRELCSKRFFFRFFFFKPEFGIWIPVLFLFRMLIC